MFENIKILNIIIKKQVITLQNHYNMYNKKHKVKCILYIKRNVTNFMKNFCDYCTEIYFESKGGEKYL